ncbi:MAG TPA: hypothetical protein PKC83_09200 [Gemmatimonadaceae bacterium]|nr:MAG: hypothetical protein ABS52_06755 [Gemmatimonadetes bacterium SCN 70-22]HMN08946.1 hypothetical protein [Gemmatimonadaceae bacterium]
MTRFRTLRVASCALLALASAAQGQEDSAASPARAKLGLAAAGAFVMSAGWASIERGIHGVALGTTVDFGHFRSPRVRLLADLEYLLTLPHEEYVEVDGQSYRDVFRDLSGHVAVAFHATAPTAKVSPYVVTGVGVHVLSSTFGSVPIDRRYNTNNFGLLGAVGVRLGVGGSGRRAVQLEVQGLQARDVRRLSVHAGVATLFNDLIRR